MTIFKPKRYPKVECCGCGNCCSIPEIPITHKDLERLVKVTGMPASRIVRFCSDSEMEFDADSGLWISFKTGKKAMVLRKRRGRCVFQTKTCTCKAYEARPQTCRTFPYSVDFEDAKCKEVNKISLNNIIDCKGVKCKEIDVDNLIANVRRESREDRAYHGLIRVWNKSGGDMCGSIDFLMYIGFF